MPKDWAGTGFTITLIDSATERSGGSSAHGNVHSGTENRTHHSTFMITLAGMIGLMRTAFQERFGVAGLNKHSRGN